MSTSASTKPSAALVLCWLLILAGCVVLASFGLATLTLTWDPCALLGGIITVSLPAALGFQQYRGAFRQNTSAALASAMSLMVISVLNLTAFAVTLGEYIVKDGSIPWAVLLPLQTISVFGGSAAWMNLSWSRRLKMVGESATTNHQTRLSRKDKLAAAAALICIAGLTMYFAEILPSQHAEHVRRDDAPFDLPSDASDVSFCHGIRGTIAYEFTTNENAFIDWASTSIGPIALRGTEAPLKSIAEPYEIQRYSSLALELEGPDSITITNGLFYHWSRENSAVVAAFDRETSRAYYFAHWH